MTCLPESLPTRDSGHICKVPPLQILERVLAGPLGLVDVCPMEPPQPLPNSRQNT